MIAVDGRMSDKPKIFPNSGDNEINVPIIKKTGTPIKMQRIYFLNLRLSEIRMKSWNQSRRPCGK